MLAYRQTYTHTQRDRQTGWSQYSSPLPWRSNEWTGRKWSYRVSLHVWSLAASHSCCVYSCRMRLRVRTLRSSQFYSFTAYFQFACTVGEWPGSRDTRRGYVQPVIIARTSREVMTCLSVCEWKLGINQHVETLLSAGRSSAVRLQMSSDVASAPLSPLCRAAPRRAVVCVKKQPTTWVGLGWRGVWTNGQTD